MMVPTSSAVGGDLGAQWAAELRAATDSGPRRDDFSWMTDNPDREPILPRRPLAWSDLKGCEPGPRDWAVENWLPMRTAALLAGRGGIGKTLLAQTLGTCLALRLDYFADTPKARRVLLWAGEDDHDELWRRQSAICAWAGVGLEELEDKLIVQPYDAREITLAGLAFGKLTRTPLLEELREQIGDYRADYVFLDSVARIFGGNENDRHHVTTFLAWLTEACGDSGVCVLGHPGKAAGSEFSGSTAWEGSVRARLYLGDRLPDAEPEAEDSGDESVRYLARRKANYSSKDWVKLEYCRGVLMPAQRPESETTGAPSNEFADDVVLRAVQKLEARGLHGNASTRSADYLPRLARQYDLLDRIGERQFAAGMRRLVMAGRLENAEVGRYSNRSPKMGLRLPK